MLAASRVNVDYLLLLLLPSLVAVVLVALTWRSRVKRQRAAEDEQRRRAARSGRSAAKSSGSPAKPGSSAAKPRGTARTGSGSRAKRRPK